MHATANKKYPLLTCEGDLHIITESLTTTKQMYIQKKNKKTIVSRETGGPIFLFVTAGFNNNYILTIK